MVEAIRFWCLASRVLERHPNPDRPRMSIALPTRFGQAILEADGLDPWIEDPTTLWMLHWQAVSAKTLLPVWWSALNDFTAVEFTEQELLNFCIDEVEGTNWPSKPMISSIKKDVDCLLRMYTSRSLRGRQTLDDLLDSPFRELGLIVPAPSGRDAYRFVRGKKPSLTPAAVAYACLDYMARVDAGARTASLTRLSADPGSPGRLFKLSEDAVLEGMQYAAQVSDKVQVASPAGTSQLVLDVSPEQAAGYVLTAHHLSRGIDHSSWLRGNAVAGDQARRALDSDAADALSSSSSRPRPRSAARRGSAA
jgi:hypothetical protein